MSTQEAVNSAARPLPTEPRSRLAVSESHLEAGRVTQAEMVQEVADPHRVPVADFPTGAGDSVADGEGDQTPCAYRSSQLCSAIRCTWQRAMGVRRRARCSRGAAAHRQQSCAGHAVARDAVPCPASRTEARRPGHSRTNPLGALSW